MPLAHSSATSAPVALGSLEDGTPIREISLRGASGATAAIMDWGCVVRDLTVMVAGKPQRVVLGFDRLEDYLQHSPHFGAIAGRFANRIDGGRFSLDGRTYQLPLNQEGKHSLHGGGQGFGKRPWVLVHHTENSATLALHSPDGDHGYPGSLHVLCRYTLAEPATLRVELSATTDATTILNLCHHSYFNLDASPDVLDHELEVRANLMTPVDADLIPTGEVASVHATPFDFRKARSLRHPGADGTRFWYDHNFILRRDRIELHIPSGLELAHAATLRSLKNGLCMKVWTSEPALQVYDGFKLNTPVAGLQGAPYGACAGICLEPQHVPDSPNLPHFPSTTLKPGAVYRQITEYRFGT
jgi:aldose 1-epimerase